MKIKKILLTSLALILLVSNTASAYSNGSLDASFDPGSGANNAIHSMSWQSDSKIIIGGEFTAYNGVTRDRIARVNSNGSLDLTFGGGMGFNNTVFSTVVQPNGKIIVAGAFSSYDDIGLGRITRLNIDGTLDGTFTPGGGADGDIYAVALQADGKIIIGGYFTSFDGVSRNSIARLNSDGTLDATFNSGLGIGGLIDADLGRIYSIIVQPDGKIIIGGEFSRYNDIARMRVARINTDGTLDATFNTVLGANGAVRSMSLQADSKIIIGGRFTSYDGSSRPGIARLNIDGTLDGTFNPGTGVNVEIDATLIQNDGKILIGGVFTNYNGTTRNNIARINSDGILDFSFNSSFEQNKIVNSILIQPDGKVIIGGGISLYNGVARNNIARLGDTTPSPATGVSAPTTAPDMTSLTDTGVSNTDNITSDTTPDFLTICVTGNTVTLYVDNIAVLPTVPCINNTATVSPVAPMSNGSHSVTYTEKNLLGESGKSPALAVVISNNVISPTIQEIVPIGTTTDTTPNYTFSTDKAGTITYGGSCSSNTTSAVVGFNVITLNNLSLGNYNNCTIRVTDSSGNLSNVLLLSPFTIAAVMPTNSNQQQNPTNQNTNSTVGCAYGLAYSPITGNKCPVYNTGAPTTFVDTNPVLCPHFTQYIKLNSKSNDVNEVRRWQAFLNQYQNEYLTLDGKFGKRSFNAVKNFQERYKSEILAPWGIFTPTGYIYKSTRAKANKMFGCSEGVVVLDNGQTVNY